MHHCTDNITQRSAERRRKIVSHKSHGHDEAERWDLAYWQAQGAEARLSALVAIREDVRTVMDSKGEA